MSAEVKLSPVKALGVLHNAPFRRYIIGSLISDTGSWMQVMAQGWVMATLTSKAIWLGMANLAVTAGFSDPVRLEWAVTARQPPNFKRFWTIRGSC